MPLTQKPVSVLTLCTHCGDACDDEILFIRELPFCCRGCRTVYQLFTENGLGEYYRLNATPGISPAKNGERFAYLDNPELVDHLVDYRDDDHLRITLEIPGIHCSSCIWLLEHLYLLDPGVKFCQVNFGKRELALMSDVHKTDLRKTVELLAHIGYEPALRLDKLGAKKKARKKDYSRWYKIGIAGFCFGNIMLLALPEYFDPSLAQSNTYALFFRAMNIVFALPSLVYVSPEYFISAWKSLRAKALNIDVPIALGIAVILLRSLFEIFTGTGPGYLDSFCGLMFFMSIGRAFQQITYDGLNFERDYTSYFPVSVARVGDAGEETYVPVTELRPKETIRLRHGEICPADAVLLSDTGTFDAAFVTGESKPVTKQSGQKVYAGLKNLGASTLLCIDREVSQSYLTELWNNKAYHKHESRIQGMTDRLSRYFTPFIVLLALGAFLGYGLAGNWPTAWNALTAVLIIACPCALALASPFTMGNALRILGRNRFFVKNAIAVETLASLNHIVFDKTGTITQSEKDEVHWQGEPLTETETEHLASLLRQSGHPLSRSIYRHLHVAGRYAVGHFMAAGGKGLYGEVRGVALRIGSAGWCHAGEVNSVEGETAVWVQQNGGIRGKFIFHNRYREGLRETVEALSPQVQFSILSGDNAGEKKRLEAIFPPFTRYRFRALPDDKPGYIEQLKTEGFTVAMVGDGLNDSGALMAADMGISVSDNLNTFSPASDAILDGKAFGRLPLFVRFAKRTRQTVKWGFAISFLYNSVGLYLALTGNLSPVLAAVLMPISSITVVLFVTVTLNAIARRMGL